MQMAHVELEPAEVEAEPLPEEFSLSRTWRALILLAAAGALVATLITLAPGLVSVRDRLGDVDPGLLALAGLMQLLSCLSYVVVFRTVFCQKMSWRTSTEIGFSELAANSILSVGGAGGLALGAWILRRGGVSRDHIARRSVAFFLLTSLANVSFLALGGLALASGILPGSPSVILSLIPGLIGIAAILFALAARPAAHGLARRVGGLKLETLFQTIGDGVSEALMLLRTRQPILSLGIIGYLLFDVVMLGVAFAAFGNPAPAVGVLLMAYLIGQLGGLIPLPGGIGGVDGGLIGALVVYGINPADAAVAVIAYRVLLLAIPAALGLPALAVLKRRLDTEAHDIAACGPGQEVEILGRGPVKTWIPAGQVES